MIMKCKRSTGENFYNEAVELVKEAESTTYFCDDLKKIQADIFEKLIQAHDHGFHKGDLYLGQCHQFGLGTERDLLKAYRCYEKHFEKFASDETAMMLAALHLGGYKDPPDYDQAAHFLREAGYNKEDIKDEIINAKFHDVRISDREYVDILQNEISGNPDSVLPHALYRCGYMTIGGFGCRKDFSGLGYIEDAAALGNKEACFFIGYSYFNDGKKANFSDYPAKDLLSQQFYLKNAGIERFSSLGKLQKPRNISFDGAMKCLENAAEKGHIKAYKTLANLYETGEHMPADPFLAVDYYARALEQLELQEPDNSGAEYRWILTRLSQIHRNDPEARDGFEEEFYLKKLVQHYDDPAAHYRLAHMEHSFHKYSKAWRHLDAAIQQDYQPAIEAKDAFKWPRTQIANKRAHLRPV